MAKFFIVSNPADGPLTFQAAVSGADAALFGLADPAGGSIINPPSTGTYTVNPTSPCGKLLAGSGSTVPVVFFAGVPPKIATATLTLSNHNATNHPPGQTWTFPLLAEITNPVAVDVALVVDRSDSMNAALGSRVKIEAAIAASQLFVELLRPNLDDRVAVVRFNNDHNVVQPITHVSTATPPTQDQIRQNIAGITPATGHTAIAGGTMLGIHEVETPHPGNPVPLNRAVVVLTDGLEDTALEPAGNWLSLMGGQMWKPDLSGKVATNPVSWPPPGIDIYAVGIGKPGQVDPGQLEKVTGTQDRIKYVQEDLTGTLYFQVEKYFTEIFMAVVNLQTILDPTYWIAPGDKHEIEFEVLRGDVEAVVVIYDFQGNRLPFFCLSPTGEIVDPIILPPGYQLRSGFTSQARLVHIKMPLNESVRYTGTWKVVVVHRGVVCRGDPTRGREPGFLPRDCRRDVEDQQLYGIAIAVGSDFRMLPFVTPAPVYMGDPILMTAVVREAGLPVTGCIVTVNINAPSGAVWNGLALVDDGAHMDGEPNDGEYALLFTHTIVPGIYHFLFHAVGFNRDGQQVVREATRDKMVLARQPSPRGGPPAGAGPSDDRPGDDGHRPPERDCCEELLQQMKEQNQLLRRLLK